MDFFKTKEKNPINEQDIIFENYRIGDMVKIIYKKNSIYNTYKGYVGEIKDYKKGFDNARLFLHAVNNKTIVTLPLDHFIKLEYF